MKKLEVGEFDQAMPIIRRGQVRSHMALVFAMTEGRQAGEIFVDDPARPRTVLVCPVNGFWFLFGDATGVAFERFLPALLAEHLVDKCAVFATSADWRDALGRLFRQKVSRIGFDFRPSEFRPDPGWRQRIPPGFTLERMDATAREKWSEGLDPWVIDVWGGPERLAAEAFGYCLLHEGKMVSFTTACAIGGGEAEVEVGTVPEFRGRGLATLTSTAFIEQCLKRQLKPAWSCQTGNMPSLRLGRKLGFVEVETVYGYPLEGSFTERSRVWGLP